MNASNNFTFRVTRVHVSRVLFTFAVLIHAVAWAGGCGDGDCTGDDCGQECKDEGARCESHYQCCSGSCYPHSDYRICGG